MLSSQLRWRRQHTKSRRGCQLCKVRRVKCDETHPKCQNCCRLGAPCNYIDHERSLTSRPRSDTSLVKQLAPKPARSYENATTRVLDLRVLHEYITFACTTFPFADDAEISEFWSISVPRMAFEHEFLLDAILGTTALQSAARRPSNPELAAAGPEYYGHALRKYRGSLASLDASIAEPMCAASILIALMTFKLHRSKSSDDGYSPPLQWFRVVKGMGSLMRQCAPSLKDDGVHLLMDKTHTPSVDIQDQIELPCLPDLNGVFESLSGDGADPDLEEPCSHHFAERVCHAFSSAKVGASRHEVRYELLGIAATCDEQFIRSMERRDHLALIALSHYFELLRWTGGNWWLQSDLTEELIQLKRSVPDELQWTVASW